jgi:hypothetical protein
MSELIDKIYDEMPLDDVICRLPSGLAIRAIKRRIKTVDQLADIFTFQNRMTVKIPTLKSYINALVSTLSVDEILDKVKSDNYPHLFSWLDEGNSKRILKEGKDKLSIEFIFNLTDAKDIDGLLFILDRILSDAAPKLSKIASVLNKIDLKHFLQLIDVVLADKRDYVRTAILATRWEAYQLLSKTQKMVAVKALAKLPSSCESPKGIQKINFKLFKNLKPLERIMALDKYLDYFPTFRKIKIFNPMPTEDEFKLILFAGCFEYNDLVENIVRKYKDITENEKEEEMEK